MAKTTKKRSRRSSVSAELLSKSREAALSAVQIFNSPMILFKSEIFIVLMVVAWTYLLHAYFRKQRVEYRYFQRVGKRRVFSKTKHGAFKHWELERCLADAASPIHKDVANNLRFLIGIRHEIEHQMTTRIDSALSAKFQACCLNYNHYAKKLFGERHGIDNHLAFSLQFSAIGSDQVRQLSGKAGLPAHIKSFLLGFESELTKAEYDSPQFAYRVLFVPKTANHKGQADEVIEFVKADSDLASNVNAQYAVIKETERPKHLPGGIVRQMREAGFKKFNPHAHAQLWKQKNAKADGKNYGVQVHKTWYWYDSWVEVVGAHCREHADQYT